jgi:type II secretory pathway pseudopilin PulG
MSQKAIAESVGAARGRRDSGFSLIEVVLAIGILSGVLLSIASMFIMGQRQVKTGKTITEATALAQDLMEAFDKQSFVALYTNLGAATTDSTFTVLSTTTGSPIASWQTEIARKFASGTGQVTIDAIGNGSPTFGTCAGIKLTTTVSWSELGRPQSVKLSTVRF